MEEALEHLRDGATWIQAQQMNTLASQQVKMQQHTMLLENPLTQQTANERIQ